jgi:hypothetical protein
VVEHEDECLCDVIVNQPTPIGVFDGVHGMWMGAKLCEVRDYNAPWTTDNMLSYFADMCTFYDRWHALQKQKYAHQNPPHERMVQLLQQGLENKVVRRMVYEEFGVEYSRANISKCKSRMGLST